MQNAKPKTQNAFKGASNPKYKQHAFKGASDPKEKMTPFKGGK